VLSIWCMYPSENTSVLRVIFVYFLLLVMYFLSIVCSPLFALCCLSMVCCLLFRVCFMCSARTEALPLCNTGGLTSFNGTVTRTTHHLHLMSNTTNPILLPSQTNKYSLTRKHAHTHAHTHGHTHGHTYGHTQEDQASDPSIQKSKNLFADATVPSFFR
jgi:hypothetical protein